MDMPITMHARTYLLYFENGIVLNTKHPCRYHKTLQHINSRRIKYPLIPFSEPGHSRRKNFARGIQQFRPYAFSRSG